MSITIKVEGGKDFDQRSKRLSQFGVNLQSTIQDLSNYIRDALIAHTPIDTGSARAAWTSLAPIGRACSRGYTFENRIPYGTILNEGLYPGVGPKTVQMSDGIFSSQAPAGMVRPVINEKVLNEVSMSILERIERQMR